MRSFCCLAIVCLLAACTGTNDNWGYNSVENRAKSASLVPTNPSSILVTEGDITDRPYTVLGDITATVNKLTIFHDNPTREAVSAELQKEASGLGADAVILVRYGTPGVSMVSWGSMEGRGRAVKFQ